MTPSNPTNSQPLIYRIADALGVFHLVAPVNHTHAQSEVEGLTDALAAKANAVAAGSPTGGIIIANTAGELFRSSKTVTDLENAIAAKMDNKTIDSTPTANSTNLVTSGGVKDAIKDAVYVVFNQSFPYYLSVLEEGKLFTCIFTNKTGDTINLQDCFDTSTLPESGNQLFFNVATPEVNIHNNESFGLRIVRKSNGVYIWYDGLFEY